MKVLVTGGCGFIGSNFIRHLLAGPADARRERYEICNLDLLTYAGDRGTLADLEEREASGARRYRFVHGDIADAPLVERLVSERFDAVVNFAAESHVDRSIESAAPFIRTNVVGAQTLLDAARGAGVARFLQVSTDEVYGALPLDSPARFTEMTPLSPTSPYAASKASADLLARAAFVTHGLATMVTRCSNNYGPYQFPEKFLPQMILNALAGKPLPIYGDGLYVRDWLHVEDHCSALLAVLMNGEPGAVYNIGGDCEKANIDVARRVLALTGRPESLMTTVADRPAHDRRYAIDAAKIRRELKWAPVWDFERGLAATVAWYKNNESWWRRIVSGDYLVDRAHARGRTTCEAGKS
ncbi:MAG TPA: dTDP-glucose 4,6-dehydratase [Candidatus Polarisedimenticolia bacterium]|nr:dTDP-glucose 4,6-dehydratase [Candidatus Polarisedimenticolia bacterium]